MEFNQVEQLREASEVRSLVGKEKMQNYLDKKTGIDEIAIKRLGSIAEKVKIT